MVLVVSTGGEVHSAGPATDGQEGPCTTGRCLWRSLAADLFPELPPYDLPFPYLPSIAAGGHDCTSQFGRSGPAVVQVENEPVH